MSEEVEADLTPEEEIRQAIQIFIPKGLPVEVRALGPGKETHSGYYDDVDKLIAGALRLSEKADGVYFLPNPFNPALAARSHNKLTKFPKSTTSDSDITRRKWLLIDCDPERPSGISASNAEHDAALGKAISIFHFLRKEQSFVGMVVADSGNGGHVLVPIDLPNEEDATELLRRVLEALSLLFDDKAVKVDQTTFNAARICKLYGTMARKGSDTPDRPHRMASIYGVQQKDGTVTREQLEAVAALAPTPEPQPTAAARAGTTGDTFDLEAWIARSELSVVSSGKWKDGKKWILNPCPWNPEHTNNAAFIIQQANGAIAAGCRHNSCRDKGWWELRDLVEPGWRDRKKSAAKAGANGKAGFQPAKEPRKGPLEPLYQFDLPPFPTEALPGWMREYVEAVTEATQTPPDMAGVMLLAACATAAQKKVVIEAGAGWREQLSFYAAVVMPPAARKSAVVGLISKPVEDFEKLEMQMQITEAAEAQNRKAILEARLKEAQKKAATQRPHEVEGEGHTDAEAQAEEIAREIANLPPPNHFRLLAEDVTPEMLAVLMAQNGGRMAVLSAEGDTFDIIAGRYSDSGKGPNLSVYLKGHTGEDLRIDRIGRKGERVEKPALTLGLAIQPQVISGLMGEDALRGRGLLARFFFSLPKNNIGYRKTHDEPIPYPTTREYRQKMTELLSLRYDMTDDGDRQPHFLRLSPEAKRVFDEYRAEIETRLRPSGDLYRIQDWGGKLAGAVSRVAGLLHLAKRAGTVLSRRGTSHGGNNAGCHATWQLLHRTRPRRLRTDGCRPGTGQCPAHS